MERSVTTAAAPMVRKGLGLASKCKVDRIAKDAPCQKVQCRISHAVSHLVDEAEKLEWGGGGRRCIMEDRPI